MITVQMKGGLGNQLFQYAAGRALAHRRGTTLALDTSLLALDTLRQFDLDNLFVSYEAGSPEPQRSVLRRAWEKLAPVALRSVYREPHFHFDPAFFQAPETVYLKGYWQSYKYFQEIDGLLREEFTVKPHLLTQITELAKEIRHTESVSLHIRRGDYRNDAAVNYHGILPLDYYRRAVEYIRSLYPQSAFFIFSDDPEWVRNHLDIPAATYVSGLRTHTHFEDFFLMQLCKHNIIANSSFSWWAAWLNDHPYKKVVAPANWFANPELKTSDLIPPAWKRL